MRHDPDPMTLLHAPPDGRRDRMFDPDSPAARASLECILAASPLPAARRRRPAVRRLAVAAVPVTLAGGALVVGLSLSSPRTGIAQAAMLTRAAAALEHPGTITYLQVQAYTAAGTVTCVLGGHPRPICIGAPQGNPGAGISEDPADDTLTYSSREWLSPDGLREHTVYDNGDETMTNAATHEYEAYDAADNTLTTITDRPQASPSPQAGASQPLPLPTIQDFAQPSYYESLYQQAQAGVQSVQLLGQSTIGGRQVYELRFALQGPSPEHAGAGDMCGDAACAAPATAVVLYLDSTTFMPVRTVETVSNTGDLPGLPDGTSVRSVTDFAAESLTATTANEGLLEVAPHPGATNIEQTEAQYRAELGHALEANSVGSEARARRR